jgi:hypothetical protein
MHYSTHLWRKFRRLLLRGSHSPLKNWNIFSKLQFRGISTYINLTICEENFLQLPNWAWIPSVDLKPRYENSYPGRIWLSSRRPILNFVPRGKLHPEREQSLLCYKCTINICESVDITTWKPGGELTEHDFSTHLLDFLSNLWKMNPTKFLWISVHIPNLAFYNYSLKTFSKWLQRNSSCPNIMI